MRIFGLVWRLVAGGVKIRNPGLETGVHDGEILVWQGDIDDQVRRNLSHQGNQLPRVVGIDLSGLDGPGKLALDLFAFRESAARQNNLRKNIRNSE